MVTSVSLNVMVLNAENLFLLSDQELKPEHLKLDPTQWQKLSTSVYENKPIEKCKAIAKIIKAESPDLILFCEVGGLESLQNFNRLFLESAYSSILIEGNSDRNIDVGFLLKKEQPFYFDIVTNKNRSINYLYPHERQSATSANAPKVTTSQRFSRDAAELHLFLKDRTKPFMIFLLTHLKSRLDPNGYDPNGSERRAAELKTLLEIFLELEAQFEGKVPIAVAGDFNGNATKANPDNEFKPLYQTTGLRDVCELAGLSDKESITYYQIGRNTKSEGKQIDYCFLSAQMATLLDKNSVKVYRYINHLGQPLDPPASLEAKMALPSDHFPLIFTLKNVPLF